MNALEITNLTKIYHNGFQALKGITLSVEKGDFFALLGANGAGKSTTIGIITSLINKTSGQVKVFDHDLDREPNDVKSCIGLVPQEFNCNIFEKCEDVLCTQGGYYGLPKAQAKERAQYYLQQLSLWDKRREVVRALSGGMKRRLMIARALVHQPKILILDEPTAGVDIEIRHTMWDFLLDLNESGTTIILTTHYLEEAEKLCRNIAMIKQGEIALQGKMKDVLKINKVKTFTIELDKDLNKLPEFNTFQANKLAEANKLEIITDNHQSLNSIFEELTQHKLNVIHFQQEQNQLEKLFLGLLHNE
jgi:ABC-2 type transport system ATP-binding protein